MIDVCKNREYLSIMIVGELNFRRIFHSGVDIKYELNVNPELDIEAEEIHAEGMEKSNDENTGGTQTNSGGNIFINKKLFRILNIVLELEYILQTVLKVPRLIHWTQITGACFCLFNPGEKHNSIKNS